MTEPSIGGAGAAPAQALEHASAIPSQRAQMVVGAGIVLIAAGMA